jgi:hypothetical protein
MIEQLAEREKQLQYTPKNKKTEGRDYSSYHRHWNKSVNKWVGVKALELLQEQVGDLNRHCYAF